MAKLVALGKRVRSGSQNWVIRPRPLGWGVADPCSLRQGSTLGLCCTSLGHIYQLYDDLRSMALGFMEMHMTLSSASQSEWKNPFAKQVIIDCVLDIQRTLK